MDDGIDLARAHISLDDDGFARFEVFLSAPQRTSIVVELTGGFVGIAPTLTRTGPQ